MGSKNQIFAGVDSGGNSFKLAVRQDGSIIARREYPSQLEVTPDDLSLEIVTNMRQLLTEHHLCWSDIDGFGAGFPNPVSNKGVIIDKSNRTNSDWKDANMLMKLESHAQELGLSKSAPVIVGNDCQLAILAAMDGLSAEDRTRTIMLAVGSGVGGSVCMQGHVPSSEYGGCEPGRTRFYHLPWGLVRDVKRLELRQLEHSVSVLAIKQLLESDLIHTLPAESGDPLKWILNSKNYDSLVSAKKVMRFADEDFQKSKFATLSMQIMKGQAEILGQFIAFWAQLNRPTKVLLGGGIFQVPSEKFQDWMISEIQSSMSMYIDPQYVIPKNLIARAAHGDYAGAIGASMAAEKCRG